MNLNSMKISPVKAIILGKAIEFYKSDDFADWASPRHGRLRAFIVSITAAAILYWLIKSAVKQPADNYWM